MSSIRMPREFAATLLAVLFIFSACVNRSLAEEEFYWAIPGESVYVDQVDSVLDNVLSRKEKQVYVGGQRLADDQVQYRNQDRSLRLVIPPEGIENADSFSELPVTVTSGAERSRPVFNLYYAKRGGNAGLAALLFMAGGAVLFLLTYLYKYRVRLARSNAESFDPVRLERSCRTWFWVSLILWLLVLAIGVLFPELVFTLWKFVGKASPFLLAAGAFALIVLCHVPSFLAGGGRRERTT